VKIELPSEALDELVSEVTRRVLAELEPVENRQEWLSVESAAYHLDVSAERVRKLIARRAITYYQDGPGCRVSLRRSELDEWMSYSRVAAVRERDA